MNPLYCRLTCGPAKHKKIISAFMIAVPFLELCEVSSCCFGKSVNDCQSSFLNKLTHCANWHSATCDSSAWLPFIIVIISWHVDVCGVFSVCFVLNFAQSVQPVRSLPPSIVLLLSSCELLWVAVKPTLCLMIRQGNSKKRRKKIHLFNKTPFFN